MKNISISKDQYPYLVDFNPNISVKNFKVWLKKNENLVTEGLLSQGAIRFRGLDILKIEDFSEVLQDLIVPKNYLETNTSREEFSKGILNASEYDSSRKIHLHTEFSQANNFPLKIVFCCVIEPKVGGATTIADNRKLTSLIDKSIRDEFKEKGITYIRNYSSGRGVGTSWQHSFQTSSRDDVESYCKEKEIQFQWFANHKLRTIQTLPAFRKHPVLDELLWFNQVDQYILSFTYEPEIFDTILLIHNNDYSSLPLHATFGDGSEIPRAYLQIIHDAFKKVEIPIKWNKGDILFLDNMLSLHGRMAYSGERRILASMGL